MSHLTQEEEIELKAIFDDFDTDNSGTFDAKELMHAAQYMNLNPTKAEVKNIMDSRDINNDGVLDFEELKAFVNDLYKSPEERSEDILQAMTTILESKGLEVGGKLTKEQFKSILSQEYGDDPLTHEEVDELFADLDKDEDTETITADEINTLFNN